jgi:hypothetical protein
MIFIWRAAAEHYIAKAIMDGSFPFSLSFLLNCARG